MSSPSWILRAARADEFARVVAVDDDACSLYVEAGRSVELPPQHPFVVAEQARWRESLAAGRVVAATFEDEPIGFASLGFVDSEAFLQQVSVRRAWMRRGVGRALVEYAIRWGRDALWLTTYADLPFNRAFYERLGFRCVDDASFGPEMRRIIDEEKAALPAPDQRVVMVRRGSPAKRGSGVEPLTSSGTGAPRRPSKRGAPLRGDRPARG